MTTLTSTMFEPSIAENDPTPFLATDGTPTVAPVWEIVCAAVERIGSETEDIVPRSSNVTRGSWVAPEVSGIWKAS